MLVNCNALAVVRFDRASRDLKTHLQLLEELKRDMDSIFRRIRTLRSKLSHEYPDAFAGNEHIFRLLRYSDSFFPACNVAESIDEEDEPVTDQAAG